MTHPSDGSLFLWRLHLRNQGKREISGATAGGACKLNKCRLRFLSLCFSCNHDNILSWPNPFIILCTIYKFQGWRALSVRYDLHIFSRVLLCRLMSVCFSSLGK